MAKKKIQVMVDASVYETVQNFATVTNQSLSAVVADYLVMAQPTLEKMTAAMSGFKTMSEVQKKSFMAGLQESEILAREQAEEALLVMNAAFTNADSRQLVLSGVGVSQPAENKPVDPITNRGDSSPTRKPRKPAPSKASKPISSKKKTVKTAE